MRFAQLPLLAVLIGFLSPQGAAAVSLGPSGLPDVVERVYTHPAHPTVADRTVLAIIGKFPYRCGEPFDVRLIDSHHVAMTLRPRTPCEDPSGTWLEAFLLGNLTAGNHRVAIDFTVVDTLGHSTRYDGFFDFSVADTTPPPPPPPPDTLPYVDAVRIVPQVRLTDRPICPVDSIRVDVRGTFPDDCFSLKAIQWVPSPEEVIGPPIVRLVVDDGACLGRPCIVAPVPWSATAMLLPLPRGEYRLQIQLGQVSCSDSIPPDRLYSKHFPFRVDTCPRPTPLEPCVIGTWARPSTEPRACDATISPLHPAQVTFAVHSSVALSGLQGEFRLEAAPGCRITRLEAVGPAAGMHLIQNATRGGAGFVMLAEQGAPIPPSPWLRDNEGPIPVLRVTVEQESGTPASPGARVTYRELLGSDIEGQGVPQCAIPPNVDLARAFFHATICPERECDHNGDGSVDVRDLVLMVHCLHGLGLCVEPSPGFFDCDGDSAFALEDVLCCARRLLGLPRCAECPPDTSRGRSEPSVRLSMGSPSAIGSGLALPLRLEGADRIGAARIVLRYPSERYRVASVELPDAAPDWLRLYDVRDAEVVIGLVNTASQPKGENGSNQALNMVLHLALEDGQRPGGEVAAIEGDFSGPDGVRLDVAMGRPSSSLGGAARIALSENRPNPFGTGTRFSLTLDRAADVNVAVYDIGGRLVAALFRGRLEAWVRDFEWNGSDTDGAEAPTGIYFYRATSPAGVAARRMVLLRRN